jgi:hypothetical protein
MRGGNEPLAKKENQMNKLIFASLLSVGAILAAQTPAAAPAAPAATAKTSTTSKVKTSKKNHSKKSTAVNSTSAKPAAK